jgi:transcriptional regulator with XRE-family HTH domain
VAGRLTGQPGRGRSARLAGHTTRLAANLYRQLKARGHYPEAVTIHGHARRAAHHADEIEAGARELLALARGHQLAEARKQLGPAQKGVASAMGVSVARVSQIEHGEVTSSEVIARYVEALGGRLDLVADFVARSAADVQYRVICAALPDVCGPGWPAPWAWAVRLRPAGRVPGRRTAAG